MVVPEIINPIDTPKTSPNKPFRKLSTEITGTIIPRASTTPGRAYPNLDTPIENLIIKLLDEIDKGTGKEPTQEESGLKRQFIRLLDKSIKKRKDEKRDNIKGLIATRQANMMPGFGMGTGTVTGGQAGELLKAQTEMENEEKKLVKMKKILKDKVLKYIEILNIMATASEQKELTESNDDNDGNNDGDTIVNKESFKNMASILIVYLKQHILSFSIVYKQIIRDIKNVHKTLLEEIEELEKKIEEYKSEKL